MGSNIFTKLIHFSTLNLTELNATASFLKRIDRKFLVTEKQFLTLLGELSEDFRVLDINGKRVFLYDNIYMDTKDYMFYSQHENQADSRTKIRTRHYTDSGDLAFFEFKQKQDGIMKKFRYQFPVKEHGTMTKGKKRFFEGIWQTFYNFKAPEISPAMKTKYHRLTLVSKSGDERLTVDFNIRIKDLRNKKAKTIKLKNLVIIESKSLKEDCKALEIIAKHGIKQASGCSKYSLGVVYSGLTDRWTKFADTMEQIAVIRKELTKEARNKSQKDNTRTLKHHFEKNPLARYTPGDSLKYTQ